MGKRLSSTEAEPYARRTSERIKVAKLSSKSQSKTLAPPPPVLIEIEQQQPPSQQSPPKSASSMADKDRHPDARVPLSEVVGDCVKRWFQDTLRDARSGDQAMQVLVGQMYQNGYGVERSEQKAKAWFTKASKSRPSAWKVSEKRPGYNVSDSDSNEVKDDNS